MVWNPSWKRPFNILCMELDDNIKKCLRELKDVGGTQMDESKKHVAVVLAVMNFWISLPAI